MRRITIESPSVKHVVSKWYSVPQTTTNFTYYLTRDRPNGVYYRRYYCYSCEECKSLRFLLWENEHCGKWKFHVFKERKKNNRNIKVFSNSRKLCIGNIYLELQISDRF